MICNVKFEHFNVLGSDKFIHAGIQDKLIKAKGYCIVVTDEGSGFFGDMARKEKEHDSYISLLNQLYDGEGDKVTLAQNKERVVPNNSTSVAVSLQQEAFLLGLHYLKKENWVDTGFGERFLVTASRPWK